MHVALYGLPLLLTLNLFDSRNLPAGTVEMRCHRFFRRGVTNATICPHPRLALPTVYVAGGHAAVGLYRVQHLGGQGAAKAAGLQVWSLVPRCPPPPDRLSCARHVTLVVCLLLYIVPPPARQACAYCLFFNCCVSRALLGGRGFFF